ncbi:MAG: hypothetical protein PHI27_06620 [Eubacteriales bacterium]|nr:hypothetical protein [Eubacteriales bacterium]MDD4513747.1 hypothetical protein [Eubacteriales bacterium]
MDKRELISLISSWQKGKYDNDYLYDMMRKYDAMNLQEITQEQAQAYYDEHANTKREREGLCYGR